MTFLMLLLLVLVTNMNVLSFNLVILIISLVQVVTKYLQTCYHLPWKLLVTGVIFYLPKRYYFNSKKHKKPSPLEMSLHSCWRWICQRILHEVNIMNEIHAGSNIWYNCRMRNKYKDKKNYLYKPAVFVDLLTAYRV